MGATARTALVLIDFQEWIVRDVVGPDGVGAASVAARAATQARECGEFVVHVRYLHSDGSDGGPDSAATRFLDCIDVLADEAIITKYGRSAFEDTNLDALLRTADIDRVVLTGVVTEGGVEATARSALDLGYHVGVLQDAVAGQTSDEHAQALERLRLAGVEVHAWDPAQV